MRITIKGQVTIPQDIREFAGFRPGTDVEFVIGDDGVVRHGLVGGRPRGGAGARPGVTPAPVRPGRRQAGPDVTHSRELVQNRTIGCGAPCTGTPRTAGARGGRR